MGGWDGLSRTCSVRCQAGLAAAGVQVQAAAPPQLQNHLIPGGLLDLLDAAAGDLGRQLLHYALQADGV